MWIIRLGATGYGGMPGILYGSCMIGPDKKLDANEEAPHGDYSIPANKINTGIAGEGRQKWSLWYRITENQPWNTDDNDAYPYDYVSFDVYSSPIKNPAAKLKYELGNVIRQDSFTPAEDGASIEYSYSVTSSRSISESQTTSVSGTVSAEKSNSINFDFEGLTGGFANRLGISATASLSKTYSVSTENSQTFSDRRTQPDLKGGVTYIITTRPRFQIIDGFVDLISHRDGVISGRGETISGGIRVLSRDGYAD